VLCPDHPALVSGEFVFNNERIFNRLKFWKTKERIFTQE
jgi:hypothetical protein